MKVKKNQHYVPQMYLRLFSVDAEACLIGMFYFGKEIFRESIPLKHQAKDDFFYGKDGALEEALSRLETKTAPFLQTVISYNDIPPKTKEAYSWLLIFTITLANRTKDAVEKIKDSASKMINEMMKYDERVKHKAGKYFIYPENAAGMALAATTSQINLVTDLRLKLIVNKSKIKFITSDHPVIRYNQFLERREHPGSHVGLAAKGLQLFFPISPNHMLCYYDDWAYQIGSKHSEIVELTNDLDVDTLNYLQALNCFDHLYFNNEVSEDYIRELYRRAKSQRLSEYSVFETTHSSTDIEGQQHIHFQGYPNDIKMNLKLSFISHTKKAKRHKLSDYAVQLRDESIRYKPRE